MTAFETDKVHSLPIPCGDIHLAGFLTIPEGAKGIVLFVHGSGSSRHSKRNQYVASELNKGGLATLLFDLLTPEEEAVDMYTREHRFDIPMLASRLVETTRWCEEQFTDNPLNIGYFGSSTGGGAALIAAAEHPDAVKAVVSRGGRPDLAGESLPLVKAPTLLIVGALDDVVIDLNQQALEQMDCEVKLDVIPGATHLFEEPGTLELVAESAKTWFIQHLD